MARSEGLPFHGVSKPPTFTIRGRPEICQRTRPHPLRPDRATVITVGIHLKPANFSAVEWSPILRAWSQIRYRSCDCWCASPPSFLLSKTTAWLRMNGGRGSLEFDGGHEAGRGFWRRANFDVWRFDCGYEQSCVFTGYVRWVRASLRRPRSTTMTVQGTVGKTFVLLAILRRRRHGRGTPSARPDARDRRARHLRDRRLHRGDDHDLQADRRARDRADLRGARRGLPGGDLAGHRDAVWHQVPGHRACRPSV